MLRIKICGLTNLEDALAAIDAGADAIGFVFARSDRRMEPEQVRKITEQLPPLVVKAGVFMNLNAKDIRKIMAACHLDLAQLHGEESPALCKELFPQAIKAFKVKDRTVLAQLPDYKASAFLLDTYSPAVHGGSGATFDWNIATEATAYGRLILSGGLTPTNVAEAIKKVRPFAVDVCSGVEESPGKKDPAKIRAFIRAARAAAAELEPRRDKR